MKKYLLFAGHCYYPQGGFNDYFGDFDSLEAAKEWFGSHPVEISNSNIDHWCHIVDRDTYKILGRFKQGWVGDFRVPGPVTIDKNEW